VLTTCKGVGAWGGGWCMMAKCLHLSVGSDRFQLTASGHSHRVFMFARFLTLFVVIVSLSSAASVPMRPKINLLVADDLGYDEAGPGQRTPTLPELFYLNEVGVLSWVITGGIASSELVVLRKRSVPPLLSLSLSSWRKIRRASKPNR
jgi:hypothetical protein